MASADLLISQWNMENSTDHQLFCLTMNSARGRLLLTRENAAKTISDKWAKFGMVFLFMIMSKAVDKNKYLNLRVNIPNVGECETVTEGVWNHLRCSWKAIETKEGPRCLIQYVGCSKLLEDADSSNYDSYRRDLELPSNTDKLRSVGQISWKLYPPSKSDWKKKFRSRVLTTSCIRLFVPSSRLKCNTIMHFPPWWDPPFTSKIGSGLFLLSCSKLGPTPTTELLVGSLLDQRGPTWEIVERWKKWKITIKILRRTNEWVVKFGCPYFANA